MTPGAVWAVVPVKPFDAAKTRLVSILDAAERTQLAGLMLEDVMAALAASAHLLAGVIVVTADERAAKIAQKYDAVVIAENVPAGLNGAISQAIDSLAATPATGVIVVPADLPHLSAAEIERLLIALRNPEAVAIIPATGDGGTNMLACRPAGAIPPLFGPQSFWRHRAAARHAGIRPAIVTGSDLEHDIDRPDDLVAFLSMGTSTKTHAFLSRLEIPERMRAGAQVLSRGMTSREIVSI
jgi:2-phospho-L-lactate guanylyltransferase